MTELATAILLFTQPMAWVFLLALHLTVGILKQQFPLHYAMHGGCGLNSLFCQPPAPANQCTLAGACVWLQQVQIPTQCPFLHASTWAGQRRTIVQSTTGWHDHITALQTIPSSKPTELVGLEIKLATDFAWSIMRDKIDIALHREDRS